MSPSLLSADAGNMVLFNLVDSVGVRCMPERDIESLGVMGWVLDAARRFFRRRRRRRRPLAF